MEIAFEAIGLEVLNENSFDDLTISVEKEGEVSHLARKSGTLQGRCWRIGDGLEVWTVLYQSEDGEVFYSECRPGFRARFIQKINPWLMTEFDQAGEAMIHGFIEDTDIEVLFELQNITEVSGKNFQNNTLTVGICGLAFRAEKAGEKTEKYWRSFTEFTFGEEKSDNVWSLCGEIIAFKALRNPVSGIDLYWLQLDLDEFELEVLVNQKTLRADELHLGAMIEADVWLQGHIISRSTMFSRYEGVDHTHRTVDFWKKFKLVN